MKLANDMSAIRLLTTDDKPALQSFLEGHADSSMLLLANLEHVGIDAPDKVYGGTYVGQFDNGHLTGVAAHCWNGNLLLQAPRDPIGVARAAIEASGKRVCGLVGPADQTTSARLGLGLMEASTQIARDETLLALDLGDLKVPSALAEGKVVCRRPRASELELLVNWRADYRREATNESDGPALHSSARREIERIQSERRQWVLSRDGRLVATCAFHTSLGTQVQIGGVWTPPAYRNRGYARAVVAGALLRAREKGAERATLFTDDPAARRAYEAIGFCRVGAFGLVLFDAA